MREIAAAIGAGLVARRIEAESRSIDEVTDLAGYDAVVLGSAVYMGRCSSRPRQFAEHHGTSLAAVPVWLSAPVRRPPHSSFGSVARPGGSLFETTLWATFSGSGGSRTRRQVAKPDYQARARTGTIRIADENMAMNASGVPHGPMRIRLSYLAT
jgi:hypothetical protein